MALFTDFTSYRGDAFRSEQNKLVVALQSARADAFNNVDQERHGVAIFPSDHPASFVIFEGDSYASSTSRSVIDTSYPIAIGSSSPGEIIFKQLSADSIYAGEVSVTLIDSARNFSSVITINHEGAINY